MQHDGGRIVLRPAARVGFVISALSRSSSVEDIPFGHESTASRFVGLGAVNTINVTGEESR